MSHPVVIQMLRSTEQNGSVSDVFLAKPESSRITTSENERVVTSSRNQASDLKRISLPDLNLIRMPDRVPCMLRLVLTGLRSC